eukprot:9809683-Alexandrium_andersonii.AAC.1
MGRRPTIRLAVATQFDSLESRPSESQGMATKMPIKKAWEIGPEKALPAKEARPKPCRCRRP